MSKKHIFIGVDGGATKTKVRIENEEGDVIGQGLGGSCNIRYSIEGAWASIFEAIDHALQSTGLSLTHKQIHFHVGMGLAGTEIKKDAENFILHPHPFRTVQLHSDAHIACLGAHLGKDGAVISIGTGVIGYQIQHGNATRVSGWGFPHDDRGGGAWLGLEATRQTLMWLDNRREESLLVKAIFAFFNENKEAIVTWANDATATEFARLAPIVIRHSQQNEALAVRLMQKAAYAVEQIAAALEKSRSPLLQSFPLCLTGGLAPFIEPWLNEILRNTVVSHQADATNGAIIMIRQTIKESVT